MFKLVRLAIGSCKVKKNMIQYKPSELVDLSQVYQKKCRAQYNEIRNVNEKKKIIFVYVSYIDNWFM